MIPDSGTATPFPPAADPAISAGQRRVNLLWEWTQSLVALSVTFTTLAVSAFIIVKTEGGPNTGAFLLLSNVFFLVLGTYFQRTNHSKSGGVRAGDTGR